MLNEIDPQAKVGNNSVAMSDSVDRIPFYFRTEKEPLFAWLHMPSRIKPVETGIVICPPMGHEYISCHRAVRHLADHLSRKGMPVLRFDYQGTGDSYGKDEDEGRLDAWLESIRAAIRQLKDRSGCTKIGLAGVRFGATMAAVIAEEMQLECLILWAPCVSGKSYVREMMFIDRADVKTPERKSDDSNIECAGFVITPQTSKEISTINLTKLKPRSTNVLIVARDDLSDDFALRDQWRQQGLAVSYIRMNGYVDLITNPAMTKIPFDTINAITDWVKDNSCMQNSDSSIFLSNPSLDIQFTENSFASTACCNDSGVIKEEIVRFGENDSLFGILCQPAINVNESELPTIILLNSGAVHHVGVNRIYVLLARNLSLAGFPTLRMDIKGLGDSVCDDIQKENVLYDQASINDIHAAIRYLESSAGKMSFVLAGLCFGSYVAFHGGLEVSHSGIVECTIINPLTFYWEEGMSLDDENIADNISSVKAYRRSMLKADRWLKLFRGDVNIRKIFESFVSIINLKLRQYIDVLINRQKKQNLSSDLTKIVDSGKHISFIIADKDPGYDILMIKAKKTLLSFVDKGNISIDIMPNSHHTFPTRESRRAVIKKIIENMASRYRDK